jgi:tripartite-type tricarboxylate transporter receptor subunit TctC
VLAQAFGQGTTYPTRAITVVQGFPAGGNPDVALRQIAARLAERLGQPVIADNRPGAAGTIAAAAVARAAPDGHTLLFGVAANLSVAPATMARPPYDPASAFTPIVEVAHGPYVWLVKSELPVRTMREFVDWARQRPGQVNVASPGQGSAHHLAIERLKRDLGLDLQHVPFTTGMYAALMGGQVDAMFDNLPGPLAALKSGRVRALAVTGAQRLAALPDVPTLTEQGLPNIDVGFWWGLVGPAGMSSAQVARLNAEVNRILAEPEVKALFAGWGIETSGGTPEAFGRRIGSESARWKDFVVRSGLKFDQARGRQPRCALDQGLHRAA